VAVAVLLFHLHVEGSGPRPRPRLYSRVRATDTTAKDSALTLTQPVLPAHLLKLRVGEYAAPLCRVEYHATPRLA